MSPLKITGSSVSKNMHVKHIGMTNSSFKQRTRDTHYELETLLIENHAHIDIDQIKEHNNDSYTHGNISHQ